MQHSNQRTGLVIGIAVLFAEGFLQVSGYQNIYLAWVLGIAAVAFFAYSAFLWLQDKLARPVISNIRGSSNLQLKREVAVLAAKLSSLEASFDNNERQIALSQPQKLDGNVSDRGQQWFIDIIVRKRQQRYESLKEEFKSSYLMTCVSLRNELSRRLGIFPPYPTTPPNINLDHGMLSGVSAISGIAICLVELADRLPVE